LIPLNLKKKLEEICDHLTKTNTLSEFEGEHCRGVKAGKDLEVVMASLCLVRPSGEQRPQKQASKRNFLRKCLAQNIRRAEI
jgi:hypothetical protein